MTKFSLFNVPLQKEFDKWVKKNTPYDVQGWKNIDDTLKENPSLTLSDDIKKLYSDAYIKELKECTPFSFNANFLRLKNIQNTVPDTFSDIFQTVHSAIATLIESKVKTRTSRSKFSYDISLLNMANVIGYQSDTLTAFYDKYHLTWDKIDPKDVIDYQIVSSIIPNIKNPVIKRNLEKYLIIRLCKQNELTNIQEWLPLAIPLAEHHDADYIQTKISLYIQSETFETWTEQDFSLLINHYGSYLSERARANLCTQCSYKHKNIPFVMLWLAEHHFDDYKKHIILEEETSPLNYPGITIDSFVLEDFTHFFNLDQNKLPVWFKDLNCYNEEIQIINDMYMHDFAHYRTLSPEYLLLSLILESDGEQNLGISPAIQMFFEKNSAYFQTMRHAIEQGEHLQYTNMNVFLILQLAGGLEKLKNMEDSLRMLLNINPADCKKPNYWEPFPSHVLQYYNELPLKILYNKDFLVFTVNGRITTIPAITHHCPPSEYNTALIAQKNKLRQFLTDNVFNQNEIELFM